MKWPRLTSAKVINRPVARAIGPPPVRVGQRAQPGCHGQQRLAVGMFGSLEDVSDRRICDPIVWHIEIQAVGLDAVCGRLDISQVAQAMTAIPGDLTGRIASNSVLKRLWPCQVSERSARAQCHLVNTLCA